MVKCSPPRRALPEHAVLLGVTRACSRPRRALPEYAVVHYQSMQSSPACITRALKRALPEHAVRCCSSQ
eukprot:3553476-Prorocentrum_lima.AAC.1